MTLAEGLEQRTPHSFAWRVSGALRLMGGAFEDVELDPRAMRQAWVVVLLAGVGRGVGAWPSEGWVGLVGGPVVALMVWGCAGLVLWGIGVNRFGYDADFPELLRTIGFAAAPLVLLALCAAPLGVLAVVVQIGAHAWAVAALVVAVREALDVPTVRALAVCSLALAVTLGALFVASFLFVAALA